MRSPYTLGEWTVRAGHEEDFVAAWRQLAEWTADNIPGSSWAKLLQDRDAPDRFVSFGPWTDHEAIAAWRQHPGFGERVARIRELVEAFTPHDMVVATEVGPPTPAA